METNFCDFKVDGVSYLMPHLQAIQEDLVKGFKHCLKSRVEIQQDKVNDCGHSLPCLL